MSNSPLSFTGARWEVGSPDAAEVAALEDQLAIPGLLAACLAQRGLRDPAQARAFLAPSSSQLHDPFAMADMGLAVDRIQRAVAARERVRVVSDYDVDGTTAGLILRAAFGALGLSEGVDQHIPDRLGEGYGFSEAAAQAAVAAGVKLLITADVGVRDHQAVQAASLGGVDVIVCDHHLAQGEGVPEAALAVLCPPRPGCSYPNPALAACGVAFKLAQALLREHPQRERLERSLLKLAALGTVADVVDLSASENRAIVTLGLAALSAGPHAPGLAALLKVAGCSGRPMTAGDLGFRVGPRINAAGRVEHADLVPQLLLERDPERAWALARRLDGLNRRRQKLQERLVDSILESALPREMRRGGGLAVSPERLSCPAFPVFSGPEDRGWHRGVLGIAASKVREVLQRPVGVAAVRDGQATGSLRSVPGVHAVQALESAADLLERFGGHPAAAGFSLAAERLPELQRRLSAFVTEQTDAAARVPVQRAELAVSPARLDGLAALALHRLEPCGRGNRRPRLVVEGVQLRRLRCAKGRHLLFDLEAARGAWWAAARWRQQLQEGPVDLLGTLGPDGRDGFQRPLFTVVDARPARHPALGPGQP